MGQPPSIERLGLNIPYEWWPAAPLLKELEAAGFSWVQLPSPPASVLTSSRQSERHARALAEALDTSALRRVIHAPGTTRAGSGGGDATLAGLLSYASEVGAEHVVYHAANYPDGPASEDAVLAETRSLARLAQLAERLGVTIALENLAPVFPGPEALSFTPLMLRTIANRIGSSAVGLCLDVGHANVVASLRRTDPLELIEPVLDRTVIVHLHDNLGARRDPSPTPELDPLRLDLHLPPGRGTIPWPLLAPALARIDAPLLLEVQPPRQSARTLFEAATRTLSSQPALTAA